MFTPMINKKRHSLQLSMMCMLACLILLGMLSAVSTAQSTPTRLWHVQVATGLEYWPDEPADRKYIDYAELSVGRAFGNRLDAELTAKVRADIYSTLNAQSSLRLFSLGPISLHVKAMGSMGMGLDGDIFVTRRIGAGPEAKLKLGSYTLAAYGVAGLHEESVWNYRELDEPFAEFGASLAPSTGRSGMAISGSYNAAELYNATESQETWSANLGYRWAF